MTEKGYYDSEWNITKRTMDDIADSLQQLNICFVNTKRRMNGFLRVYLSLLWGLHLRLEGMRTKMTVHHKILPKLEKAQLLMNRWEKQPNTDPTKQHFQEGIAELLYDSHRLLIHYMHEIGIGITVRWKMSDTKRMKKQAGIV